MNDHNKTLTPLADSEPSDDAAFQMALRVALKKLSALNKEKMEHLERVTTLDSEIARLRSKLVTLASLVTDTPKGSPIAELKQWLSELGLTDAIREVLKAHDHGLTPKEVRDWLLRMGFDLTEYNNVQASIHAVLKRLYESGEVDRPVGKNEKVMNVYRWSPVRFEGKGILQYQIVSSARRKRKGTERVASKKK